MTPRNDGRLLANLVFEPALEVVDEERLDEVVAAIPEGAVDLEVYAGNMRSDPMSYNRSFFSQIEESLARRCVVLPVRFGFELGETGFFGGGALEVGGHLRVYESALFTSFLTTFCFGMMALAGYGDEPLGFKDRYDTEAYLSECVHNYVFLHNDYSFERGIGLLRFGVFMGEKGAQLRFAMELFALMHEVSHIILGTVDSAGIENELAADRLGFDLFGKVFRDIDYVQGPGGVEEMIWAPLLFFYVLCYVEEFSFAVLRRERENEGTHPGALSRASNLWEHMRRLGYGDPSELFVRNVTALDDAYLHMREFGRRNPFNL